MSKPDSPVNVDEIIERKKQELADWIEFRRLAEKLNVPMGTPPQTSSPTPESKKVSASPDEFDGTVRGLVKCYRTDKRSTYHQLKFAVRKQYESSLNRLINDFGSDRVAELDAAKINHFYETIWAAGGKPAMGHNMVGKLRMLSSFGSTVLKDDGCTHLAGVLAHMRTKPPNKRTERMTTEHANSIRSKAHETGRHSIALAQAFQFEVPRLRGSDIIGEWVPLGEPGTSEVMWRKQKWLRGLRWSDIYENLILRRTIPGAGRKKQPEEIEVDLNKHPMILEELFAGRTSKSDRSVLPASGPIIISETTGYPYDLDDFRRKWRDIANEAGVPPTIRNSDSIRAEKEEGSQRTKATYPWQET